MNSILDQLKIIEVGRILPFESVASSAIRPTEELRQIRNPLPTLQMDDDYLLLGDTDHYLSLMAQGLTHLPIQALPEQLVSVPTTAIGLVRFDLDDLQKIAATKPSQIIIDQTSDERPGFVRAEIDFGEQGAFVLHLRHNSHRGCPSILTHLLHQINVRGFYFPLPNDQIERPSLTKAVTPEAVLNLPPFTLDDLRAAALTDRLFPDSLIQTTTACRVLNLDFPISVLKDSISVDEKRSFIHELIRMREHARRTALVDGRVYLLNR